MLVSAPVDRSSSTATWWCWQSRASTRWDPINPAPPVMRTRIPTPLLNHYRVGARVPGRVRMLRMILRSDDIDLFYEVRGEGPDVVMLHPFPSDHTYWLPLARHLESRFRLVLPDLCGLGRSGVGAGATTMAKVAADVLRLCDELKIG